MDAELKQTVTQTIAAGNVVQMTSGMLEYACHVNDKKDDMQVPVVWPRHVDSNPAESDRQPLTIWVSTSGRSDNTARRKVELTFPHLYQRPARQHWVKRTLLNPVGMIVKVLNKTVLGLNPQDQSIRDLSNEDCRLAEFDHCRRIATDFATAKNLKNAPVDTLAVILSRSLSLADDLSPVPSSVGRTLYYDSNTYTLRCEVTGFQFVWLSSWTRLYNYISMVTRPEELKFASRIDRESKAIVFELSPIKHA